MKNKVSPKGVLEIVEQEGLVLGPYKDSVDVWTDGVGHTAAAGGHDPSKAVKVDTTAWNDAQAKEQMIAALAIFDEDLDKYEKRVNEAVLRPLSQHQFDALVSFDFNTGGIYKAILTKEINAGDMRGDGFMGWVKPKEIIKRRKAEQALFRTGNYEANGDFIPVYDTTPTGKVKYRTKISGLELQKMMDKVSSRKVAPSNTHPLIMFLGWLGNLIKQP